jgi:hypothetical protein
MMIVCIVGLQNEANDVIDVGQDRFLSRKSKAKLKEMKASQVHLKE